jgi:hypothetical protein
MSDGGCHTTRGRIRRRRWIFKAAHCFLAVVGGACATPPRPTAASLALAANERAVVEGRVAERDGLPVAGIQVQALPRGKDVGWSPPAVTDSQGRFRLTVIAPAEYGFLVVWQDRTVITPEKDDPARLRVAVSPGERRAGIELLFLREAWETVP